MVSTRLTSCQSCLMPFKNDPGKRESDQFCSYCFKNGKLCYEGNNLKEFQAECYKRMRANGMGNLKAKLFSWMVQFAPRWKHSK